MGKHDLAVNQMLERKDIFADLMNGIVFQGEQVVKPEKLEQLSPRLGIVQEKNGRKKAVERSRDICMEGDIGRYSLILAEETQNKVHYAMPVRTILYDALEYARQVQNIERQHKENGDRLGSDEFLSGISRTDRLKPVLTIVLYFGKEDEWDGSRSLYELLDIDEEDERTKILRKYIPDYRVNLIQADQIENTNMFQTCLQQIFEMLKYRKDKKQLSQYIRSHREELKRMDEVETMAAVTLLGEQRRMERLLRDSGREEEKIDMSSALTELLMDAKEEVKVELRESVEAEVKAKLESELKKKLESEVKKKLKTEEVCIIRKKLKQGVPAEVIAEWTEWKVEYVGKVESLIREHKEASDEEIAKRYLAAAAPPAVS